MDKAKVVANLRIQLQIIDRAILAVERLALVHKRGRLRPPSNSHPKTGARVKADCKVPRPFTRRESVKRLAKVER